MAQLNFYVPDDVEDQVRRAAKRRGLSISAYLAELVKERVGDGSEWPVDFFDKTLGGWQGDFPEIERLPPQERDWPE
jgi:hypothetical protein